MHERSSIPPSVQPHLELLECFLERLSAWARILIPYFLKLSFFFFFSFLKTSRFCPPRIFPYKYHVKKGFALWCKLTLKKPKYQPSQMIRSWFSHSLNLWERYIYIPLVVEVVYYMHMWCCIANMKTIIFVCFSFNSDLYFVISNLIVFILV